MATQLEASREVPLPGEGWRVPRGSMASMNACIHESTESLYRPGSNHSRFLSGTVPFKHPSFEQVGPGFVAVALRRCGELGGHLLG